MKTLSPLRKLSARPEAIVDHRGVIIADPDSNILGVPFPVISHRIVYALPTNVTGGHLSARYRPPHPPNESCTFTMDFSNVIPLGVSIQGGTLTIKTNTVPPANASSDWTAGPVQVQGRQLSATLRGGVAGTDYILLWTAGDTQGNNWPRTGLVLCAATS